AGSRSARADTDAAKLWERPCRLAASELVHRHLVDVGLEVQVVPVTADVLRFYHHVSGQTPLHASRPLPAVHNGQIVRGKGYKPVSLRICRRDVGSSIATGNDG